MIERRTQQLLLLLAGVLLSTISCNKALLNSRHFQRSSISPRHGNSNVLLSMAVAKTGGKLIRDETDFIETVLASDAEGPIMVFFTAPWCGPCRLSVPVVKDVMKEYAGQMSVVEVCTDDLPEVASDAGVVSIPTIQMYYQGELLDTIVGCVARNVLASSVEKVLEDSLGTKLVDGDGDDEGEL